MVLSLSKHVSYSAPSQFHCQVLHIIQADRTMISTIIVGVTKVAGSTIESWTMFSMQLNRRHIDEGIIHNVPYNLRQQEVHQHRNSRLYLPCHNLFTYTRVTSMYTGVGNLLVIKATMCQNNNIERFRILLSICCTQVNIFLTFITQGWK